MGESEGTTAGALGSGHPQTVRDWMKLGIPYQEFYKVIEFGNNLDEEDCNRLEEALLKNGNSDALVIDEQYKRAGSAFGTGM